MKLSIKHVINLEVKLNTQPSYAPRLYILEGFVIFWTSKLITSFIDSFTPKVKSQSIVYLLNGSEHTHTHTHIGF